MRIVIGGGSRCGKTTLADKLGNEQGLSVWHSDDLIEMGWSEASAAMAEMIGGSEEGIFEGVAATRALRKLLEASKDKPCDIYIHLTSPYEQVSKGQATMNKGVDTVFSEIRTQLHARGVKVLRSQNTQGLLQ